MASTTETQQVLNSTLGVEPGMLTLADYLTSTVSGSSEITPFFLELIDNTGSVVPLLVNDTQLFAVKFDINPTTISINMSKIINRTQTMTAWTEDHWGDELDTITFQGSTAAFIVGGRSLCGIRSGGPTTPETAEMFNKRKPTNETFGLIDPESSTTPSNAVGLTTEFRRQSASYQKLKRILQLMVTNGCRFGEDVSIGTTNTTQSKHMGLVTARNYVRFSGDYINAVGYIESFDVSEAAEMPFRLTYTITFKVEKIETTYLR